MKRYYAIQGYKDTLCNTRIQLIPFGFVVCGMPQTFCGDKSPQYMTNTLLSLALGWNCPSSPDWLDWGTKLLRHRVSQIQSAGHQAVRVVVHLTHSVTTDGTRPHRPPPDLPPNSLRRQANRRVLDNAKCIRTTRSRMVWSPVNHHVRLVRWQWVYTMPRSYPDRWALVSDQCWRGSVKPFIGLAYTVVITGPRPAAWGRTDRNHNNRDRYFRVWITES